jgi:hypothetical protein
MWCYRERGGEREREGKRERGGSEREREGEREGEGEGEGEIVGLFSRRRPFGMSVRPRTRDSRILSGA